MENQEQIINQLKAEIYDLSKQLQQANALVGQIATIVKVETVDELLSKLTQAFGGKQATIKPAPSGLEVVPEAPEQPPVKPKPASRARSTKLAETN